jgi:5-methylcytosine-specific restriction endonuclease McrA
MIINEYKGIVLPWNIYPPPEGPILTGKDGHGTYHIMTGLEGTGVCWLCGSDPGGKRYRRYCWGHGTLYYELFCWNSAAPACIERAGHVCENCGKKHEGFEVHHIIPLEGTERIWSYLNLPWNLICLCHECHMEVHAAMRGDGWDKLIRRAEKAGQLILDGFLSRLDAL